MKNVLFFVRFYHPHIGGVEKHVQKISGILKENYQITLVTEQYDKKLKLQEKISGINIFRIPVWNVNEKKKKWTIWTWLWDHQALIREADIIHVHDVFYWFLPFNLLFPSKKVFVTFHGYETQFPPSLSAKLQRKLAVFLTYANISVGKFIANWYSVTPTVITYGATDQKLLPLSKNHAILVLGRISADNDMDMVIDALQQVKKQHPKIEITFLGDGEFRQQASKVGKVIGFDLITVPYLSKASLVIASSYLSILDALAAGRQVVSVYSNPLKKDYLLQSPMRKHTSVATDKDTLEELVSKLISRKLTLNKQGETWAQKQTWDKLAKTYQNLWKK